MFPTGTQQTIEVKEENISRFDAACGYPGRQM
jgi:hypothetical protein